MRRALDRAAAVGPDAVDAGDGLALDDVATLLAARDADLSELFDLAARHRAAHLRAEGREGTVTHSRSVFVPLTRLCRDRCHYCTFVTVPGRLPAAFLEVDEVLDIARRGAEQGCTELLFTLGDRPEARWDAARAWLSARGYDSTIAYVRACAVAVLRETGLLPHLNPGVMSPDELALLRPVSASMGMMLETTSRRLFAEPGGAHYGSPDKDPAVRLAVIDDAGRARVPFTSGILVGIGEDRTERADSLIALADLARRHAHLQEAIIQNFRAKPATAMQARPDAEFAEFLAAVAVARLVLPSSVSVQAPPNLAGDSGNVTSARAEQTLLLRAGIDDWGGVSPVTPDHVNPERPWPGLAELAEVTAAAGFELVERLPVHPRHVRAAGEWLDPAVHAHVAALADDRGLANGRAPVARAFVDPAGSTVGARG
jgi:7,8-didemethyl-8-hydroxy-5-deazariboflavin synthase CofG subunit